MILRATGYGLQATGFAFWALGFGNVAQSLVDFGRTFAEIEAALGARGVRLAVVGGIALAAYGHPRTTLDLDLVTEGDAQDVVVALMEGLGFQTLHRSTGYSNHLHQDAAYGRVDFVYVRGTTLEQLFEGVRILPGPGGINVPVPRPEHLVAMKVHAIRNSPERLWQDMADIGFLVRLDGVDRDQVRGYFEKAHLLERWRELEAQQ
jgi:Nucleotidyl transferase AbiEii toxin, Type IV TA system